MPLWSLLAGKRVVPDLLGWRLFARERVVASTLVKIDIHLMFHVKSTGVTMRLEDLPRIFRYIGGVAKGLGSIPLAVGGMPDHVHVLASLPKTLSLVDFVRTLKSESSKWMKSLDPSYERFAWQDGYGAFSVSASVLPKTTEYIQKQEEHHKRRSFREEYRAFLEANGVEFDERFAFGD